MFLVADLKGHLNEHLRAVRRGHPLTVILVDEGVTSALTQVECLRTLDRLRIIEHISDEELASRREAVFGLLATLAVVDVAGAVLDRAAQPLPTA